MGKVQADTNRYHPRELRLASTGDGGETDEQTARRVAEDNRRPETASRAVRKPTQRRKLARTPAEGLPV